MKRFLFCAILLLFFSNVFAQTPQQIEADLLKSFKKIGYWYQKANDGKSGELVANDSLAKVNDDFARKLTAVGNKYQASISWPFASLKKAGLTILTSDDNLLRIYSWDTQTGGTEHFFENVFQYRSGSNTAAYIDKPNGGGDDNAGSWYKKIYSLKSPKGTYYMATYLDIESTKDMNEGVQIISIVNGKLNSDTKIIKTQSGLHSQLSYEYDFSSIIDIPYEKRPTITFDSKTQTIHLPLVNSKGMITKGEILYKFDGQYFIKEKH